MTDYEPMLQPDKGQSAQMLHLVDTDSFDEWYKALPDRDRQSVKAQAFKGKDGQLAIIAGEAADEWMVAVGVADAETLDSWCLAKAAEKLPSGTYRLDKGDPDEGEQRNEERKRGNSQQLLEQQHSPLGGCCVLFTLSGGAAALHRNG